MSNLAQRILMFFTFVPLIVFLLFFLPDPQHLALQIVCLIVGTGLAFETVQVYGFFTPDARLPLRRQTLKRTASMIFIAMIPLGLRIMANTGVVPDEWALSSIMLFIFITFGSIIPLTQKLELSEVHERMRAYLMVLVYPVAGMQYFLAIFSLPDATLVASLFMVMVFANDTMAYLAGKFLGKGRPHPFRISPNKTMPGFIGGFLMSIVFALIFNYFFPSLFPGGWVHAAAMGATIGLTTIMGDLFESSLKRNSGLKDSGQLIPGRGGLLDSLDSLLFSAPFFWLFHAITHGISLMGA